MTARGWVTGTVLLLTLAVGGQSQTPGPAKPGSAVPRGSGPPPPSPSDIELVEHLIAVRRDYQTTLEKLRAHYNSTGETEKARWAEEELIQFHRISKQAFRLELDVPPPTLQATYNVPAANELYMRAIQYKDRGYGTDYIDNQRRAELLLQKLLTAYPQCSKISDAAYQLGDIYESKANRQYRRAAVYFERCFQWNTNTHLDARLRAARIYDRSLAERQKAVELYKMVLSHEIDPARRQEAERRIAEINGQR